MTTGIDEEKPLLGENPTIFKKNDIEIKDIQPTFAPGSEVEAQWNDGYWYTAIIQNRSAIGYVVQYPEYGNYQDLTLKRIRPIEKQIGPSSCSLMSKSFSDNDRARAMLAFDIFDSNKNGIIDETEFTRLMKYPGVQSNAMDMLTDKEIKEAMNHVAKSKDGKITREKFYQWYSTGGYDNASHSLSRPPEQLDVIRKNIKSVDFLENFQRLGMKPTYYCFVCLENQPIQNGTESVRLSNCGHRYCTECLTGYLVNAVNNGQVYPLCFYLDSNTQKICNAAFNESEILKLLPEVSKKKYHKFKANKNNENIRECSKCGNTQVGDPKTPSIICDNCGNKYCFTHGDAHQGSDCATYDRIHHQEEKRSCAIISKKCKSCPKCKRMIFKSGGCNHMKCPQCQCSFCWLCMEEIEDIPLPNHYKVQPGNIGNPCIGRQMEGMNTNMYDITGELTGYRRICWVSFLTVCFIVFAFVACPLSLIWTFFFVVICGVCVACRAVNQEDRGYCAEFFHTLRSVFTVFACMTCLLIGLVLCIPCFMSRMNGAGCIPRRRNEDGWGDEEVDEALREQELLID